jgi:hypothetical protein
VRDANGQALAYLYSRESEGEARQAKVLTLDEARRIAVNIARLPELLGKADRDWSGTPSPYCRFVTGAGISLLIEPPALGPGLWERRPPRCRGPVGGASELIGWALVALLALRILSGDLTWRRLRPPSTPRSEPQWW